MKDKTFNKSIKRLDTVFIDDPRRAIVIGVFILAAIILLAVFWKRIKNAWQDFRTGRAASSELSEYTASTGETATMSNSAYYQYANQLYNAFRQHLFGWGTDEDAIYNVFMKMNNTADVLKLIKEFGVKDGKTLPVYVRSELNKRELNKLNSLLAGKGIEYTF